jgi:hypothetical protein
VRLVLDEHLDPAIAVQLRRSGREVVAVKEDDDLVGLSDRDLLDWAVDAGRVIVTYNVRHFRPLCEERQVRDEPFAGIVFISARRYPQGTRSLGALVRDLSGLMEGLPARDALSGRSIWLGSE